jgi:hypothetical protein
MTIILLLYVLQKYYLNESVTFVRLYRYVLQSQNAVKRSPPPLSLSFGVGEVYS